MLDFYGVSSLFFFIEPLAEYTSFRGVCTRDGTLSSELFRFPFRFFFSFSLFFFFFRPRVVLVHRIGPSDCDSVVVLCRFRE